MDEKELVKERITYIENIAGILKNRQNTLIPTIDEQRSFEEALRHVIHVASSKGCAPTEGTFSCGSSSSHRTCQRKQCLNKIFDQLCWMERQRLYDPPGDDEIGHYLLIKKYIRAIMAFNLAATRDFWRHRGSDGTKTLYLTTFFPDILLNKVTYVLITDDNIGNFRCSSLYYSLHHAEEFLELNRQLEELSEFFLGKDNDDGFTLAPLMGIKESNETVSIVSGSNERSYMFYSHKFLLASIDLENSKFAHCPPFEDEKRSYVHVLYNIAAPLIRAEDEKNVYSAELFHLYVERIYHEMIDIERHLAKIKGWILKNLSLMEWWESMAEQIKAIEYDEFEDHDFVEFTKELAERCEVSNEDLPDYISQIDRFITIARLLVAFILGRTEDNDKLGLLRSLRKLKQTGWEIVHALSLFKHGPSVGNVFQEKPILQNPQELVPLENHQVEIKHKHIVEGKGQGENVVVLEEIIDDLRCIGDSNIVLDQEEKKLVHKIWGSVASSTHFFVSAKTYEQRRHMMENLLVLELPTMDMKETIPLVKVDEKQLSLEDGMINFARILEGYKIGLQGKLRSS